VSATRASEWPGAGNPRRAATLVLLRDAGDGLEVLVTIRPAGFSFMGGAAVFPGGAVEQSDLDAGWERASLRSPIDAASALNEADSTAALALFVCAAREAFEEVGFLAGEGPLEEVERAGLRRASRWPDELLAKGIRLDTTAFVPAGRWVTPAPAPVRFDAHFFVTTAPSDWEPVPNPREVDDCFWITPRKALDELAHGRLVMAPPTIRMLQRLGDYSDATSAIAAIAAGPDLSGPLSVLVHPHVRLVLAPNPGMMTGPGTNTYVVGAEHACVIDPAVDDSDYLHAVTGSVEIKSILVTHRHADHTGGVSALAARTGAAVRAFGSVPVDGVAVIPLADGDLVEADGVRLIALHTPGHSADHLCFVTEGCLFSGDTVLGEGTSVIAPPDGSLSDYLASLERLRRLPITRLFPGHFRPVDRPTDVIESYITHRAERHQAILQVLKQSESSVEEIVARVYTDTPPELHPIAAWSVLAHLAMARDQGQVEESGSRWRLISKGAEVGRFDPNGGPPSGF
jgi:glyoxylase-like metal-dependent hydrolase (beta-lactamase superfamily II)/8-oxo-dGTP pyrophosphatase MutT (NUDIX family)